MKVFTALIFALAIALSESKSNVTKKGSSLNVPNESSTVKSEMQPNPRPIVESDVFFISDVSENEEMSSRAKGRNRTRHRIKNNKRKQSAVREAVQVAAIQGLAAMIDLYEKKEPEMLKRGDFLPANHPASLLSEFSAPTFNTSENEAKGAYASLFAAKKLSQSLHLDFTGIGRQSAPKISLKRTSLEGLCPPREHPQCVSATKRYRTHDGTCNNKRKPRWGSAHLPFHRFLAPDYRDGIEEIRTSVRNIPLPSARFVSLLVHGFRDEEAKVTMMLPQWGQFIDHDVTSTVQPRSQNGSIPSCCNSENLHPSCLPIKVPRDDPWLAPLNVRCLEFLRSAPAQRRDCLLSWREQTNQATAFLDASPVYSSNARQSDNSRIFKSGLLLFGRGPPREDVCLRGALAHQCTRPGDTRAGEQPGLLALHTVFVGEHNRIALELSDLNPHWSDEKLYQETRRIIGAMFQHITYREFLPLVLGKEVCNLFDLELLPSGFFTRYDPKVNPTIANSFSSAAFRFGHSLIKGSMLRTDINHNFLTGNVSLHEENARGDIGNPGSLHRLLRGMSNQRALKRDEFMSPELTNHLFQSGSFPFGMDLAAINIQRGRDHGLPSYTAWRQPCGLSAVRNWRDFEDVVGPRSADRIRRAYENVDDIDLFVAGVAERPVVGGLVGPTFACIIAQQFSNLRRGDRFWYENPGFESSFTPAQLQSVRQVSLAQIICRGLGSGTLQPHLFIPPDVRGNERAHCGSSQMAPINLLPWTERDPFNTLIQDDGNSIEPSDKLEELELFEKPNIHDRIDPLTSTTGNRPNKKPTPVSQDNFKDKLNINNKLDFKSIDLKMTTKKPTKLNNSTVTDKLEDVNTSDLHPEAKTNLTAHKQLQPAQRRDDLIDLDEDDGDIGTILVANHNVPTFSNQDNATKYMHNSPIGSNEFIGEKSNIRIYPYSESHAQNDYNDYNASPYRPYVNPTTRPTYYRPTTKRQSVVIQNNEASYSDFMTLNNRPQYEPIYYSTRKPLKPTLSPISNKVTTPFSYDSVNRHDVNSHDVNYESASVPLYISPQRPANRPLTASNNNVNYYQRPTNYYPTTTYKPDLQTFLIVETTKRTTPFSLYLDYNKRTSLQPSPSIHYPIIQQDLSYYSRFPTTTPRSHYYPNPVSISSIDEYDDITVQKQTNISTSYFITNKSTKRPQKHGQTNFNYPFLNRPTQVHESFSVNEYETPFSDGTNNDEYDGYLRPEQTKYVPIKITPQTFSYNDYTKFNTKPVPLEYKNKNMKYYYEGNKLYKYVDPSDGLYSSKTQIKRYADFYDTPFNDFESDDFVAGKMIDKTDKTDKTNSRQTKCKRDKSIKFDETKPRKNNVLIIPLNVLTRFDRPDDWVMFDAKDKKPLPDYPVLTDDPQQFSTKELPRPLLNFQFKKKGSTNFNKISEN